MANRKLKPCPFCGGPAQLYWPNYRMYGWVECADQDCRNLQHASHMAKDDAVKAWNRRDGQGAGVGCPNGVPYCEDYPNCGHHGQKGTGDGQE